MNQDRAALEARIRQHLELGHLAEAGIAGFRKQAASGPGRSPWRGMRPRCSGGTASAGGWQPANTRGSPSGLAWARVCHERRTHVVAEAEDARRMSMRCEKGFERLKERLVRMAEKEGLLESRPN